MLCCTVAVTVAAGEDSQEICAHGVSSGQQSSAESSAGSVQLLQGLCQLSGWGFSLQLEMKGCEPEAYGETGVEGGKGVLELWLLAELLRLLSSPAVPSPYLLQRLVSATPQLQILPRCLLSLCAG